MPTVADTQKLVEIARGKKRTYLSEVTALPNADNVLYVDSAGAVFYIVKVY